VHLLEPTPETIAQLGQPKLGFTNPQLIPQPRVRNSLARTIEIHLKVRQFYLMANIKGTDWQRLLHEVLAETDLEVLKTKADDLEMALFLRKQEIGPRKGLPLGPREEWHAMNDATRQLLRVRVEKLGFPMDAKLLEILQGGKDRGHSK
jgi:hypothetical protein